MISHVFQQLLFTFLFPFQLSFFIPDFSVHKHVEQSTQHINLKKVNKISYFSQNTTNCSGKKSESILVNNRECVRAFFHQLNGKVARTTQVCPSSKKYLLQTLVLHENMRREVKQFRILATNPKGRHNFEIA